MPVVELPTVDSSVRKGGAPYDTVINGLKTTLFKLRTTRLEATFTNYGARIISLKFPDKNWKMTDVVLGLPSTTAYVNSSLSYLGATVGRYANRIEAGKFTLNGTEYTIGSGDSPGNRSMGGAGFHDKVWTLQRLNDTSITFSIMSPDMEAGFPGNLYAEVSYTLTQNDGLRISYLATTDKACPINIANPLLFNLNGEGSGSIQAHMLQIFASQYTPVDAQGAVTGEIKPVAGTPFDFTRPFLIGRRIGQQHQQLIYGNGYDINYVVNGYKPGLRNPICSVTGDLSGIQMVVATTEPGIWFYSGNAMMSQNQLKSGAKDDFRTAFSLQPQHFPDSPNQPSFPTTIVQAGDTLRGTTEYIFSVKN